MAETGEVICRVPSRRAMWWGVGVGAAGAVVAALRAGHLGGPLDPWFAVGVLVALVGLFFLYAATARLSAGAYGLCSRTLLRRRTVPWSRIVDLRRYIQRGRNQDVHRVSVLLDDGR
ncbi:PH domain-containing protein, partial [Streptomyces sp. DT225]